MIRFPYPTAFLKGEEIKFGKEKLKVLETPGHTPGSISLFYKLSSRPDRGSRFLADGLDSRFRGNDNNKDKILFTGDTLFADGLVGRTDFSYSSKEDLEKSLRKISKLAVGIGFIRVMERILNFRRAEKQKR